MKGSSLHFHPLLHPRLSVVSLLHLVGWLLFTLILIGLLLWATSSLMSVPINPVESAATPRWIGPNVHLILTRANDLQLSKEQYASINSLSAAWDIEGRPIAKELAIAERAAKERGRSVRGEPGLSIRAMTSGNRAYDHVLTDFAARNSDYWDRAVANLSPTQLRLLAAEER